MLNEGRLAAVIFDWGNTLCDYPLRTQSEQLAFLRQFIDEQAFRPQTSFDPPALAAFNSERTDNRVTAFARRVRHHLWPDIGDDELVDLEQRLCRKIWARGAAMADAGRLLKAISRAGLKVAIVSNTPWGTDPRLWRAEVERHPGVLECCQVVTFCGDCGFRKPDPAPFLSCLERLAVAPGEAIVVGDSYESDIVGAQRTGCPSILVGGQFASTQTPPTVAVERLSDVFSALPLAGDQTPAGRDRW